MNDISETRDLLVGSDCGILLSDKGAGSDGDAGGFGDMTKPPDPGCGDISGLGVMNKQLTSLILISAIYGRWDLSFEAKDPELGIYFGNLAVFPRIDVECGS